MWHSSAWPTLKLILANVKRIFLQFYIDEWEQLSWGFSHAKSIILSASIRWRAFVDYVMVTKFGKWGGVYWTAKNSIQYYYSIDFRPRNSFAICGIIIINIFIYRLLTLFFIHFAQYNLRMYERKSRDRWINRPMYDRNNFGIYRVSYFKTNYYYFYAAELERNCLWSNSALTHIKVIKFAKTIDLNLLCSSKFCRLFGAIDCEHEVQGPIFFTQR